MAYASGVEPVSRRAPGADGIDLHLLEWSSEGVPLLLVHGFSNEAHIWDDFAPNVAPYYRTVAIDLRGHGDSTWDPDGRYDHETMARDLEAATAALGIERLVLIGHSLGGHIATIFAERNLERLAGFVLVDVGPEIDPRGSSRIRTSVAADRDPSYASIDEFARTLSRAYPAAQADAIRRMALYGVRQREDGRFVLKMDPALRSKTADASATRDGRMSPEAQWKLLARIPCPTLVVRGAASDLLAPDTAERMQEELPNGRLEIIERAGHSVMTDNPDGFRDAVTDFVLA